MKFVKTFQGKTQKDKPDSLLYHLHHKMAGPQAARPTKKVHASEMYKTIFDGWAIKTHEFCPREYALLDVLKKDRPEEFITAAQQKTFDEGNMTAEWLIGMFADLGLAVGDWECRACGEMHKFRRRPVQCDAKSCGHKYFKYHEVRFLSEQSGISCGVDMLFLNRQKKLEALEFKSMKDEDFKALAGPMAEHKWRTNLYMRIVSNSDDPRKDRIDCTRARVLYVCKGGWGWKDPEIKRYGKPDETFSPFKEFTIKRDDKVTQVKWEHAVRLKQFRDKKKGMPLGLCPTSFCTRASVCSVREHCFSGKYPGEE